MSEIKSALELALERTADVKSDKSRLEAHEAKQVGMRLAGKFLEDQSVDVARELKQLDRGKQAAAREGFYQIMISHLTLPTQQSDLQRVRIAHAGLSQVIRDAGLLDGLMDQVMQYLEQYLETKNQLTERLRQQYEPRIRQKEEQIAAQTGRRVRLDPANDPEFANALNQNIQHLQSQYGQVIDQAREQLDRLIGASS